MTTGAPGDAEMPENAPCDGYTAGSSLSIEPQTAPFGTLSGESASRVSPVGAACLEGHCAWKPPPGPRLGDFGDFGDPAIGTS